MMGEVVLRDAASGRWLRFGSPREVLAARTPAEVVGVLARVERAVEERGLHAAGFVSYEAAPAFDAALRTRPPSECPLAWFGLYEAPREIAPPREAGGVGDAGADAIPEVGAWTPSVSRAAYGRAFARVKEHIARGDTYQVNYTVRWHAPFRGDPWRLFARLAAAERAPYAAYVDAGRFAVCSVSPELFFRLEGSRIVTRPMKGTAARGRTLAEDEGQALWLGASEKNRAENVMIVDMMRNDVGRIAATGTVTVPRLYEVERYPGVWQMTSSVAATTDAGLGEIFAALFPCASVTGAPKPRTMSIIAQIESEPRGIYTGCVGYVAPGRRAQFNVAIRTVVVDREAGQAVYGAGGGIVWDSQVEEEYAECVLKTRALAAGPRAFSLLETMRWRPEAGYFLLSHHLRRLRDSAVYFGFDLDPERVRAELARLAAELPARPHRVRLRVDGGGGLETEAEPLAPSPGRRRLRLRLAPEPVDAHDPFLYHKTTCRGIYEAALAARRDADDVILWNERGEVCETSVANLVVRRAGELVTPPVGCGLLGGTFRAWALEAGRIREGIVTVEELRRSPEVYLVNSVRGWLEAALE